MYLPSSQSRTLRCHVSRASILISISIRSVPEGKLCVSTPTSLISKFWHYLMESRQELRSCGPRCFTSCSSHFGECAWNMWCKLRPQTKCYLTGPTGGSWMIMMNG